MRATLASRRVGRSPSRVVPLQNYHHRALPLLVLIRQRWQVADLTDVGPLALMTHVVSVPLRDHRVLVVLFLTSRLLGRSPYLSARYGPRCHCTNLLKLDEAGPLLLDLAHIVVPLENLSCPLSTWGNHFYALS